MAQTTLPMDQNEDEITRHLNFLARLPMYETIKPYAFRTAPGNGFPATNVENESVPVQIRNMRVHSASYETHGFSFHDVPTAMTRNDYDDAKRIQRIRIPEIEGFLRSLLQASYVQVLNYGVSSAGFTLARSFSQLCVATEEA
jgi:hypothetical protein